MKNAIIGLNKSDLIADSIYVDIEPVILFFLNVFTEFSIFSICTILNLFIQTIFICSKISHFWIFFSDNRSGALRPKTVSGECGNVVWSQSNLSVRLFSENFSRNKIMNIFRVNLSKMRSALVPIIAVHDDAFIDDESLYELKRLVIWDTGIKIIIFTWSSNNLETCTIFIDFVLV